MTVRNFWVNAHIDGQITEPSFGPKSKNGGMDVHIAQRENGGILSNVVEVRCFVLSDGSLVTHVSVKGHDTVKFVTER